MRDKTESSDVGARRQENIWVGRFLTQCFYTSIFVPTTGPTRNRFKFCTIVLSASDPFCNYKCIFPFRYMVDVVITSRKNIIYKVPI